MTPKHFIPHAAALVPAMLFLLLLLIQAGPSPAQKAPRNGQSTTQKDAVDRYIDSVMTARHIPGLALAVIKDGKVLKEAVYGLANVEHNVPVKKETVFEIASMSKQFTCAAILLLQQQGKLSVQDRLSKYLDSLPDSWKEMRLYQLMNHTAGLRDDWEEENSFFLENHSDSLMFAKQKKYPLLFAPGESFHYGAGPFTLGLVIAKVSGQPYARFMREQIFRPLGMNSTSIFDSREIVPNRAAGYLYFDSVLTNGMDISSAATARGDVGVITSIDDMIKWNAALDDNRLFTAASRAAMFTPGTLNDGSYLSYGFGWFQYPSRGHLMIEHSGGFRTGFNTDILRFPAKGLAVITLCNNWTAGAYYIGARVVSFYDSDLQALSLRPTRPDPNPARTAQYKDFMTKAYQKTWSDKELYKQANFCGDNVEFLEYMLKGMKNWVYIDSISLAARPMHLYGEDIATVLLYRAEGGKRTYWSMGLNREGKLVYVFWEG
jgi:CubicO group peptidase (beta-lactamase class C family)